MGPIKVTFLGTGTSQGIPMIACACEVCQSNDTRDKRLRVSLHLDIAGKSIVVDTGPDFRQQMLRESISHVDAILYTHEHKDHTAGLDDIRGFNYFQKVAIPLYAQSRVIDQLKREFAYAFDENKYPGVPDIQVHEIDEKPFELKEIEVLPIRVKHFLLDIFGYRIGDFTYITDANFIEEEEIEKIKGTKVLVLNALRKASHVSHFNLAEALEIIAKVNPEQAYLTHVSHQLGLHAEVQKELPPNVFLAYDGLKITI
ncbi:MAG: Phosphoribosyl 1,2-cyclic phosphate phosphodiesterase [Bacteroidota bacterium]|jgi:phosphoribosyl 1,2-cyclic phosphate phosphodiesterase